MHSCNADCWVVLELVKSKWTSMNWSRWTIMGYRITVSVERSPNELAGNVTLYLLPHGERSREVWSSSYIHLVISVINWCMCQNFCRNEKRRELCGPSCSRYLLKMSTVSLVSGIIHSINKHWSLWAELSTVSWTGPLLVLHGNGLSWCGLFIEFIVLFHP